MERLVVAQNVYYYLLPLFLAFFLSIVLTPLVRKFALSHNIVDAPNEPRKIHSGQVPLLGGVAVFAALAITIISFWRLGWLVDEKIASQQLISILLAGLIIISGGFLDDKYHLKPYQQIWFPLLAAVLVVGAGVRVNYVTNPLVAGSGPYGRSLFYFPFWLSIIFSFLWLVGIMYTTKLLDGLDGLVSGVGLIGALILFIVSLFWDIPLSGTSLLALILAGALAGFLFFNFHPAKIFLGEGGSLLVGFMLGVLSIISGAKIATTLLIMGIPILDVVWVIGRRLFWEKRSPLLSDKKHLHFRLLNVGLSHRQAVIVLYLLTLIFGVSSIFLQSQQKVIALGILVLVMLVLASGLVVLYKRKEASNN